MRYFFPYLLFCLIWACSEKAETVKPELKDITESVYASVTVLPDKVYRPFGNRSGVIKQLFIEEGDTVQSGQVLARIAAPNQQTQVASAELRVKQAQDNLEGPNSRLQTLQHEIQKAQKMMREDSINFQRQKRLWNQNIGSKVQFESAKLKYELSHIALKKLRDQKQQTSSQLSNDLEQAMLSLRNENINAKEFTIQALQDGLVYARYKEVGEMLGVQEPIAMIGSTDSFYVEMSIDEVDVVKISLGDTVLITLDAYPEKVFEAEITALIPLKEESTQTFRVESRFLNVPPLLYHGMAGEANIIVDRRAQALIIPVECLTSNSTVKTSSGEVSVTTGIRNLEYVEILSGIDTSTVLYKIDVE